MTDRPYDRLEARFKRLGALQEAAPDRLIDGLVLDQEFATAVVAA